MIGANGPPQALKDFQDRIRKYEEVYETITDRNLHYIKLIDMCAFLPMPYYEDSSHIIRHDQVAM